MLSPDELKEAVKKDSQVNRADIGSEVFHSLELQAKWINLHHDYKNAMIHAEQRLKQLVRDAVMYYGGKATAEQYKCKPFKMVLGNQTERDAYIDSDPTLCEYKTKYETAKECLFIVEYMLDSLKYRNKTLELFQRIREFESGD